MATIRQRKRRSKDGVALYHVVDFSVTKDGRTRRKQKHFRVDPGDPHRARLLAEDFKAEIDRRLRRRKLHGEAGVDSGPADVEIADWLDEFCKAIQPNCSPKYHQGVVSTVRLFRKALAENETNTTAQVQRRHFTDYARKMRDAGSEPKTIRNHLAIIKQALRWAIDEGWLDPALIRGFPSVRVPEKRRRALTPDEIEKLLTASEGTDLQEATLVALYTGARRGELVQLQCSDIDLERGVLDFRGEITKAGTNAQLPIHDRIRSLLEAKAGQEGHLVKPDGADRWNPNKLTKRFTALVREELGWTDVTFHCLRHTMATRLAASGKVTALQLQRLMRHRHIATSLAYINWTREQLPPINVW